MKKYIASLLLLAGYYGIWVFISGEINLYVLDPFTKFIFVMGLIFPAFIIARTFIETPPFLKEKTHEEKKAGISKYIGELHGELKLYGEAKDLEKRIRDFRTKQ